MQPNENKNIDVLAKDIRNLAKELTEYMRKNDVSDANINGQLLNISTNLGKLELLVANSYVRREEFNPVQKIVYGLVSVILMGVVGALLVLVLK